MADAMVGKLGGWALWELPVGYLHMAWQTSLHGSSGLSEDISRNSGRSIQKPQKSYSIISAIFCWLQISPGLAQVQAERKYMTIWILGGIGPWDLIFTWSIKSKALLAPWNVPRIYKGLTTLSSGWVLATEDTATLQVASFSQGQQTLDISICEQGQQYMTKLLRRWSPTSFSPMRCCMVSHKLPLNMNNCHETMLESLAPSCSDFCTGLCSER